MSNISELFLKFKNKEGRWESDCAVVEEIIAEYYAGDQKTRSRVVKWSLERIENSETKPLVRNNLIDFIGVNRRDLSDEERQEFEKFDPLSKDAKK